MYIEDNDLGMLEQLCYIDTTLIEKATGKKIDAKALAEEKKKSRNCTVGQFLENLGLNDEAIKKLASYNREEVSGSLGSGAEWASILTYIKGSNLNNLVLRDFMTSESGKTVLGISFCEWGNTAEAVVAFVGTSEDEWIDNVEGLNISDTKAQKEALDFIESLSYDHIIVTGHSKGGNKAMYVTITSDKVDRCVSYDGQGFSQEFMDKYWAEINSSGTKIKNFSLSTDYVHALMFPVPNSQQIYCKGFGVDNIGQHHSPNSFFYTNSSGRLELDENGKPIVFLVEEAEAIEMLHDFTTFVLNNADEDDKRDVVGFLAPLLHYVFRENEGDKIKNYLLDHPDEIALVLAYLVKYMDEYDIGADEVNQLLETLGLDELNKLVPLVEIRLWGFESKVTLNLANILEITKKQLSDSDGDFFITSGANIFDWYNKNIKKEPILDGKFDVSDFWKKVDTKAKNITISKGCKDASVRADSIHDFSNNVYHVLMNSIHNINRLQETGVDSWKNYEREKWFSELHISVAIKGITSYFSKMVNTNAICKERIENVFADVHEVEKQSYEYLSLISQELEKIKAQFILIGNRIVE